MDASYEQDKLRERHKAFERSLATDREWDAHLDLVAPVVTTSDPLTFICFT
jgi:hypothetical protein